MPFSSEWVPPEEYMSHAGVTVYHVYKDDDVEQGARTYWYTVNPEGGDNDDEEEGVFDIREFDNPNGHDLNTTAGQQALLRELIDAEVLDSDGTIRRKGPVDAADHTAD